ncbi:MAG: glycosyltransferase family 87 protein [Acidobacteriota bacterium]
MRRTVWLLGLAFLGVYLYRNGVVVWPFLFRSVGDFGNHHEAGQALLRGESPFANWLNYPPLLPFLMAPLALLDYETARIVWFLAGHACLLGAALLLWRPLGGDLAAFVAVGAVWAFAGAAQESLGLGQMTPLLLLLVAWAMQPARSGTALGLATALKLWPGVLLAGDLLASRWRALWTGIVVAVLGVAVPQLLLMALTPPPWGPLNSKYWMGTPAPLNVSIPATALRLTYSPSDGEVPKDWEAGNHTALRLPDWRWAVSAATAGVVLVAGLLLVARFADPGNRVPLLASLVALALLASPIAWYHYQMMQFPGLAWLTADAFRRRAWSRLAGVTALEIGLTRPEVRDLLLAGGGAGRALLPGLLAAALGIVLFGLLLGSGRSGEPPRRARNPSRRHPGNPPGGENCMDLRRWLTATLASSRIEDNSETPEHGFQSPDYDTRDRSPFPSPGRDAIARRGRLVPEPG